MFNLLEGTRALEMLNPNLDTGLITLLDEEIAFDSGRPQLIDSVIAVQNRLLHLLPSWLNNSSLPLTVLSCRYVQTLLENYAFFRDGSLSQRCSLVDRRLQGSQWQHHDTVISTDSLEYQLVHKVLKLFIIGLAKFVGITLDIAMNVLYEEEDITTRTAGLDFLGEISTVAVLDELNHTIEWILASDIESGADVLISQLKLVLRLNQLNSVFSLLVPLFEESQKGITPSFDFLSDGTELVDKLSSIEYNQSCPGGAFSRFIQLDRENKTIPVEVYEIAPVEAWKSIRSLFQSVQGFVVNSHKICNYNQLINFLRYDISTSAVDMNIIARGIFQLYVIRDDRTILGCPNITVSNYSIDNIENVVGKNTDLLYLDDSSLSSVKPELKHQLKDRLQQMLQDLESCVYHNVTVHASNVCRQQQLMSKSLVLWDTLQVSWESFEVECFQLCKIGNELPSGDLGMAVSSYVYFTKLQAMIDLALNGVNLELYKDFEIYLIYWYVAYLIQLIVEHLTGRIDLIIEGKIAYIEKTHPKKIKKFKAGPKKQQLKELQLYYQNKILPQLVQTRDYNRIFLTNSLVAMNNFLDAICVFLMIISNLGICDFRDGPKSSLTSMEDMFHFRMKPWSSIGVPSLPTYAQYINSFKALGLDEAPDKFQSALSLIKVIKNKLHLSKSLYQSLLKDIVNDDRINSQFVQDDNLKVVYWYESIVKCIDSYSEEVEKFVEILESNKNDILQINSHNYKLKIIKSHHRYFPRVTVEKTFT